MKSGLFLLPLFVLLAGCASQDSVESSTADARSESVYTQSLPVTDMDASRMEESGDPASGSTGRERTYARELAFEEEVIVPQSSPALTSEPEPVSEVELANPASSIDLYNTFTLQLVAMDSMGGAIAYARQHAIDPEKAGVARILSHGKIYYVLAYGIYANEEQAEQASQKLQQAGIPEPWIRRLGTLERLSTEANEFQPIQ